ARLGTGGAVPDHRPGRPVPQRRYGLRVESTAAKGWATFRGFLSTAGRGTRVHQVDGDGIHVAAGGEDRVIDVLFDDRRIWSFWLRRDTTLLSSGRRLAAWPDRMQRFLNGHSRLMIREHVSGDVLFDEEHRFGDGD